MLLKLPFKIDEVSGLVLDICRAYTKQEQTQEPFLKFLGPEEIETPRQMWRNGDLTPEIYETYNQLYCRNRHKELEAFAPEFGSSISIFNNLNDAKVKVAINNLDLIKDITSGLAKMPRSFTSYAINRTCYYGFMNPCWEKSFDSFFYPRLEEAHRRILESIAAQQQQPQSQPLPNLPLDYYWKISR